MLALVRLVLYSPCLFIKTISVTAMNLFIVFLFLTLFGHVKCWLNVVKPYTLQKQKVNSTRSNQVSSFGCRKDRHCQPDQFCHRYERSCKKCRVEGEKCRRNKMCCRGMECASGKCRRKVQLGQLGALCTKDRECNYGMCCARQNGQSVCKPMLQEGDACGIPAGGRTYFWNHQCPCAFGLKCKRTRSLDSFDAIMQDWESEPDRRCVRPKVS